MEACTAASKPILGVSIVIIVRPACVTPETSCFQKAIHLGRQIIGRAAIALSIASGLLATEATVTPPAAIADTGGYPNSDAAELNLANYDWWVDENGNGTYNTDEEESPRGYGYRNCTDWVAWRIGQTLGRDVPPTLKSGKDWNDNAPSSWTIDSVPESGDVAHSEAGFWGHVGFVEVVDRDSSGKVAKIIVSEYNRAGAGEYSRNDYFPDASGVFWRDGPKTKKWNNFLDLNGTGIGINGENLNQPAPPPDPDTDGDGIKDSQDRCPTKRGFPHSNGCPVPADYNRDGRADVVGFYRHDGNVVDMRGWWGQTNGYTTNPTGPWSAAGWDGNRIIPTGRGDFNGDGKDDVSAFYRHDGGMIDLNIWYGDGVGNFSPFRAWHVPAGWDGSRLIPAGSGDINRDGRADIVAFYRHDNNLTDLRIWYGQSNGYTTQPTGPWSGAGWDGSRVVPIGVGDLDGDGKLDISTFYRHDGGMIDHNVWYGNGVGDFTLARPWHIGSGWDAGRLVPVGVADFNRDGKADSAAFYRHDSNVADLRIWYGTSNRLMGAPGGPWSASGWDGQRIVSAGTGDYNGDGKADVATFYRHVGGMLDMNIWYGDGGGNLSLVRAWHVPSGWEGERIIPAQG